ncbi:receptor-transporting protein 3-like [Salminus brasiliensis]|uniref:receptor-transporting protein 3-like n=1 Tax=Salminus brasiliensis TaxID=930266 RepID=UPI003B83A140
MAEQWNSIFQKRATELDGDEWTLELDDSIVPGQNQQDWNQYIRNAFAEFSCSLCSRWWPSKQVKVVFHFSLDPALHRGTVKVKCFKQKCRECFDAEMEEPCFSSENIDVMVEKLMEKIRIRCYGAEPPESNRNLFFDDEIKGPHESDHCEACLRGFCQENDQIF